MSDRDSHAKQYAAQVTTIVSPSRKTSVVQQVREMLLKDAAQQAEGDPLAAEHIFPQARKNPAKQEYGVVHKKTVEEDVDLEDAHFIAAKNQVGDSIPTGCDGVPDDTTKNSDVLRKDANQHAEVEDKELISTSAAGELGTESQAAKLQTLRDLSKFSAGFTQVDGSTAYNLPEVEINTVDIQDGADSKLKNSFTTTKDSLETADVLTSLESVDISDARAIEITNEADERETPVSLVSQALEVINNVAKTATAVVYDTIDLIAKKTSSEQDDESA